MKQFPWQWFKSSRRIVLMLGSTAAVAGLGWWGFGQVRSPRSPQLQAVSQPAATGEGETGQRVTVATAELAAVPKTLDATGTVNAQELLPINTQLNGQQIVQVLVEEGDVVQAGQTLAVLDSAVLQAQFTQAQGTVGEAEARVAELRAGTRSEEIARAQESVRSAEAGVTQARLDLELSQKRVERNGDLMREGVITEDRFDEVVNQREIDQAALEQAQARVTEAQELVRELQKGPRPEVLAQAQARLKQAQGQAQSILAQLNDTRITAPRAGQVAERTARIGAIATTSEPLFTIIQDSNLELALQIPETQLAQVRLGQKVVVRADASTDLLLTGKVAAIDPIVDQDSRQAIVKVSLPPNRLLRPGIFLRGQIITDAAKGIVIPAKAALPQSDGKMQVFLVQANRTAKARLITVGELLPNAQIEVLDGLNSGDRVVVEGAAYLQDGDELVDVEAADVIDPV